MEFDNSSNNENIISKLDVVMHPMNLSFWKNLKEELGGMVSASAVSGGIGAAPTPALGQITGGNISGCMVNGVAVAGKSVKKKKKKLTKNENIENIITLNQQELLDKLKNNFNPEEILATILKNEREIIKVLVYNNCKEEIISLTIKIQFIDVDGSIIDEIIEDDLSIEKAMNELIYLFKCYSSLEEKYNSKIDNIIETLLNEDFKEEYENITALISKQLDKLNFEFANTEDIIYKKEGENKYLIKFDNEIGVLKFKVSKDKEVIFEKEFSVQNEEDVNKAFEEISEIYLRGKNEH